MALQNFDSETHTQRPDLANRFLMGRLWNPRTAQHDHLLLQFEQGKEVIPGTMKGGPILFGTFLARWEAEFLRLDWTCATRSQVFEGRTFAAVEQISGGRVKLNERWIEADDGERPGFLSLEEPMSDEHR